MSQFEKTIYLSVVCLILAFLIELDILLSHLDFISLAQVGIGGFFASNSLISLAKGVILVSGIGVLLLAIPYGKEESKLEYETPLLVLLAIIGMLLLVSSRDMVVFYLSIELLSLSFYILATADKTGQFSTESGLKYFLLGALSSALLLFGFAILYGVSGETSFEGLQYYS